MPTFAFTTYQYSAHSGSYNKSGIAAATLDLYGSGGSVSIYFFYDETSANRPPAQTTGTGIRVLAYYHISMLPIIIDMLRNEGGYFYYDIPVATAYLATGKELAGEGET